MSTVAYRQAACHLVITVQRTPALAHKLAVECGFVEGAIHCIVNITHPVLQLLAGVCPWRLVPAEQMGLYHMQTPKQAQEIYKCLFHSCVC